MTDQPSYNRARNAKRASYDRASVTAILEAGLVGHVGFIADGRPMVMPMIYAMGEHCIYLHGASKARIIKLGDGTPLSMTVTLLDGIVAARSAFHHSMNYRSAVVHGTGRAVTDPVEHDHAMQAMTEHLLPERYREIRPITAQERKATGIIALDIEAASVKIRQGPPSDDAEDLGLGLWAGVVPITTALGRAVADNHAPTVDEPNSVRLARQKFS